jgi:hypothetical protein
VGVRDDPGAAHGPVVPGRPRPVTPERARASPSEPERA